MPNGLWRGVRIPARIFPGVFPEEYQVTIQVGREEFHLNVSANFVMAREPAVESGVDGYLTVDIIDKVGDKFVIALPGEVQGAPSRVKLSRDQLQVVA